MRNGNFFTELAMTYFPVLLIVCACIIRSQSTLCESSDSLQGILQRLQTLESENEMLKKYFEENKKKNYDLTQNLENLEKRVNFVYDNNKAYTQEFVQRIKHKANALDVALQNSTRFEKYGGGLSTLNNQKRRRIIPPTSDTTGHVAFHAYLSGNTQSGLRQHHTLVFDSVRVNKGSGYNKGDGIFVVPQSGVYVFAWTVTVQVHGWASVEIVVNEKVIGSAFADGNTSWDEGSGIVLVEVNTGDHVFLRMQENGLHVVNSNARGRSTFSGWKLF